MKQRIVRKSGLKFFSPILVAEELLSKQQAKLVSTKRYGFAACFVPSVAGYVKWIVSDVIVKLA